MNSMPKGYRFNPTDQEIMDLLKMKMVNHDSSVKSLIPEIDVLEYEPWDIFSMLSRSSYDKECHFFAPRKRKYPRSDRADRCTKAGQWKPTGKRPKISSLGIKRRLTFYLGRPHATKTGYVMHQYELNDMKDFALCCLKRKKNQDFNGNTSGGAEHAGSELKQSQASVVQPFQMVEQEANQESFVPHLQWYGEIDSTNWSSHDQRKLHDDQLIQETDQESLLSLSQIYDEYVRELFDDQLPYQEANQEIIVQPKHGCTKSSCLSSFAQGESCEDFDYCLDSFIASILAESPMESDISNKTLQTGLAIDGSQAINEGLQAPADA